MPADDHIMSAPRAFDDDRLLAYALGLDDDPELAAAAAADPALHRHLERVLADLGQIERQLELTVPPPGDDWADLSADRWEALRPYVAMPRTTRRRHFSWRVLAPVVTVAAAVAIAVGITISGDLGGSSRDAESAGDQNVLSTGGEAAPTDGSYGQEAATELTAAYQVVAVARASSAEGSQQTFTVLRTLKGQLEDDTVALTVGPAGGVPEGRLALLFLQPQPAKTGDGSSPAATPDEGSAGGEDEAGRLLYRLADGTSAPVLLLPEGTAPGDVTLP